MLTAAFAELDRLCPQGTRADIYESSRTFFYGTWTAAGRPEKAFKYVAEPVCPEALRALWCCWHLGTRVLINYGLTRYAAEHQHQANSAEYFGQPWITANVKGGLFSDMQDDPGEEPADPRHSFMSDGLWIGTVSRRELVLLKNILAIRWLLDDEPTALYVAMSISRQSLFWRTVCPTCTCCATRGRLWRKAAVSSSRRTGSGGLVPR